jgi:hypothetical protein
MKRFIGTLIATLTMMSSQASTIQTDGEPYMETNHIVTQRQTVTPNVQARAKHKRVIKTKVVNLKVHRFLNIDDDDNIFVQEEDLATGYRRRDLNKIEHPEGLSEKIRWRLFLARQLALLKYKEVHG